MNLKRPFWVVGLVALLGLFPFSCQKRSRLQAPTPVAAEEREPEPDQAPVEAAQGNCSETVPPVETALSREAMAATDSETLFWLALCYLGGPEALRDRTRALQLLRAVESAEQGSRRGREAGLLLRVISDAMVLEESSRMQDRRIQELENEVEGLKAIDLRRKASRPPK